MRVTLENGQLLLVSVILDENGKPRLDIDFLRMDDAVAHGQLEVHFDGEERAVGQG